MCRTCAGPLPYIFNDDNFSSLCCIVVFASDTQNMSFSSDRQLSMQNGLMSRWLNVLRIRAPLIFNGLEIIGENVQKYKCPLSILPISLAYTKCLNDDNDNHSNNNRKLAPKVVPPTPEWRLRIVSHMYGRASYINIPHVNRKS